MTHFQALYGYPPLRLLNYMPRTSKVKVVEEALQSREHMVQILKLNLQRAQNQMLTVASCQNLKLMPRFYGLFHPKCWICSVSAPTSSNLSHASNVPSIPIEEKAWPMGLNPCNLFANQLREGIQPKTREGVKPSRLQVQEPASHLATSAVAWTTH